MLWAKKFGGLKFFHGPKMLGGGGQHFYGAKTLNWGPENILVEKSVLPKNIFEQFGGNSLGGQKKFGAKFYLSSFPKLKFQI